MSDPKGTPPAVSAGQVWREVDPRRERFIRVHEVRSSRTVTIYTVDKRLGYWSRAVRAPVTDAHPGRFNGKRGGYEYVEGP